MNSIQVYVPVGGASDEQIEETAKELNSTPTNIVHQGNVIGLSIDNTVELVQIGKEKAIGFKIDLFQDIDIPYWEE